MKTKKSLSMSKSILMGILITGMMFPITLSAQKNKFLTSSVVPAAQGYAKVKRDKNKNYTIKVEIRDLAEVARLQASKVSYVVWMETDQNRTENLGQLNSSSGFLSKQNKASLETVSSYKPSKIYITAEEFTNARYPGDRIIMTTDRF
ncbi:MAG: hypothetical protein KFF73_07415 [Cyclobacteriaceae bacterium]|nr:hypothetical protein [Cyclobacteriaceae bacterium]